MTEEFNNAMTEVTQGPVPETTGQPDTGMSESDLEALIDSFQESRTREPAQAGEHNDEVVEYYGEPNYVPTTEREIEARQLSVELLNYGFRCNRIEPSEHLEGLMEQLEEAGNIDEEERSQSLLLALLEGTYGFVNPRREGHSDDYSIPENSPTWMMDRTTSRFSGTAWFSKIQEQSVILAGLGGIGANLAFQLARMHLDRLLLYDGDKVELENMSGQLYSRSDVGRYKADAMVRMIGDYANTECAYAVNHPFLSSTEAGDIMMCGFDSMSSRHTFFDVWEEHVKGLPHERQRECLFLDGRLSIDNLQVFAITGDDMYNRARYRTEFLFSDWQAEETVCSMKQTTYLACMIGSFMTNLFTNFTANLLDPVIPYDLPFLTEYDAKNMLFRTER